MSPAAWGALSAIVGPSLLFVTYMLSRGQLRQSGATEQMSATVDSALSTTEIMRGLLAPMESEIGALRVEVALLRGHILVVEGMLRQAGIDPPPFPSVPDS